MSKFGFSWSWKRATGISALRGKIARATGVPTTRAGRQRKIGRLLGNFGLGLLPADQPQREPQPQAIDRSQVLRYRANKLQPKYVESRLVFTIRRFCGLSLLLCSVVALVASGSWYFDATPSIKTPVIVFGLPGLAGLAIAMWMCRGRRKDRAPMATAAQMDRILELHGTLPRQVTAAEAADIVTFLESHKLDCPFCGAKCKASNMVCGNCRKRLDAVRVPITFAR
jgi:hypothetical protein